MRSERAVEQAERASRLERQLVKVDRRLACGIR
jgi:hypothetical protein